MQGSISNSERCRPQRNRARRSRPIISRPTGQLVMDARQTQKSPQSPSCLIDDWSILPAAVSVSGRRHPRVALNCADGWILEYSAAKLGRRQDSIQEESENPSVDRAGPHQNNWGTGETRTWAWLGFSEKSARPRPVRSSLPWAFGPWPGVLLSRRRRALLLLSTPENTRSAEQSAEGQGGGAKKLADQRSPASKAKRECASAAAAGTGRTSAPGTHPPQASRERHQQRYQYHHQDDEAGRKAHHDGAGAYSQPQGKVGGHATTYAARVRELAAAAAPDHRGKYMDFHHYPATTAPTTSALQRGLLLVLEYLYTRLDRSASLVMVAFACMAAGSGSS